MKDGIVAEDGRHESLIKSNGVYAELIQAQQFGKRQPSAASSIRSSPQSSQKGIEEEDTTSIGSSDLSPPVNQYKKSALELIGRSITLSRDEAPAIFIGLVSSIFSGGVIIGEVSMVLSVASKILETPVR